MLISGCKKCRTLPPFGQLPALKKLFIEHLDRVKVVGVELLGAGPAFPSLEILSIRNMRGWEKWSMSGVLLPCLQNLTISDCPNLVEVTLEALPPLSILHISECDSGVLRRLVQVASSITKLEIYYISRLNDEVWGGIIEYLNAVEYLRIMYCNEIRYLWESEAVASKVLVNLRILEVSGCDNLMSLGEKEDDDNNRRNLPTALRMLKISFCNNMERFSCPESIETLRVVCCNSITVISLPTEGLKLKSLEINCCDKLLEKEWGVQKTNTNKNKMAMLDHVSITGWANLKSFIGLNHFVHLTSLSIGTCANLESFHDNELSILTSLMSLGIYNCPRMDACFPRGIWPPNLRSLMLPSMIFDLLIAEDKPN